VLEIKYLLRQLLRANDFATAAINVGAILPRIYILFNPYFAQKSYFVICDVIMSL